MDPMTIMQLASLLGSFGGFFFKDNSNEKLLRQLMKYTSPQALTKNTEEFYKLWLQGPAYGGAVRDLIGGSNRMASDLAQSLSARGLGTSGIGAITSAASGSALGSSMAGLKAKGYAGAQDQAMRAVQMLLGGASGMTPPRDIGRDTYAGALDALGKMMSLMTTKRTGATGGGLLPYGSMSQDYFETLRQTPFKV